MAVTILRDCEYVRKHKDVLCATQSLRLELIKSHFGHTQLGGGPPTKKRCSCCISHFISNDQSFAISLAKQNPLVHYVCLLHGGKQFVTKLINKLN